MKNTLSDVPELPQEVQIRRLQRIMEAELTEKQRAYLSARYFDRQTPSQIARRFGIHRSTVTKTLLRAEARLRRFLIY